MRFCWRCWLKLKWCLTMTHKDATSFVNALLARMTLEDKIGQLVMVRPEYAPGSQCVIAEGQREAIRAGKIGSMLDIWGAEATRDAQSVAVKESRLGIPLLFAHDVLHGYETIFPTPLGEAAAFSPKLWEKTARAATVEMTAGGVALTFAPMLDAARDPRWGRIVESFGEDPWLGGRFAEAKVRGFQGAGQGAAQAGADLSAADAVAATAKHLGAYGAVTAGREYAAVDISPRTLHEVHLPAFRAAVDKGVAAIMPAFTSLNGVPMTGNADILQDVVRRRWEFDGVMISDFGAVGELIAHGVAGDLAEAAGLALAAGIDIDMASEAYPKGLAEALSRGLITEAQIDAAVTRVLLLKARLGLFDDAFRRGATPVTPAQREAHRQLAREAARRSMVLLQDRENLLPLNACAPRHLAVIGPFADAPGDMLGPWHAAGDEAATASFFTGLKAALPGWQVSHARGAGVEIVESRARNDALDLAEEADITVLCLGEASHMCGEATSRANPGIPHSQRQLAEAVLAIGKPVVVVLTCGRPLIAPWLFEAANCVLAAWFPGSEAGNALADILTGAHAPSGKLPVSWPAAVGQIPITYAERVTGRPANPAEQQTSKYLDAPVSPQFPFGHGLTYTRFAYANLRVSPETVRPGDTIHAEVDITNEGNVPAQETAFLFVRDALASVVRPVMELKAMGKITLAPGETGVAQFTLSTDDLAFYDDAGNPCLEPGQFKVLVGARADRDALLAADITLQSE
jgi:beta-glucosidase